MEPGLIGGEVNKILANHAKKGNHPIQVQTERLGRLSWAEALTGMLRRLDRRVWRGLTGACGEA